MTNPVHIALCVGGSFTDQAMNGLRQEAFTEYPRRYQHTLLKWPYDRKGTEPRASEIENESAKFLEFGVCPVCFDTDDTGLDSGRGIWYKRRNDLASFRRTRGSNY